LSGALIAPIAEHFFVIKALQKLYLANTITDGLFQETKNPKRIYNIKKKDMIKQQMNRKAQKHLKRNRIIKISLWN